ncbi:MAG: PKD domain-containing protein [Candidatus Cloacimonetes bacterium]|nr:PKD domain-containing protein [Candidatus Cloacimonadota bacterium]
MRTKIMSVMLVLFVTVVLGLAGCGGGSGSVNSAPVANAGTELNVRTGRLLTLDGSASSDADGNTLSYAWSFTSKPAGSNAVLSDTTSIHPAFTPDIDGSYVINLVVNDGKIDSAPSVVTIKSVTDLRLLFSMIIARAGTSIDGYVQPGSSFSSNIKNISNETFILSKYEITNGGNLVSSTTNASLLNNNLLAPGESVSIKYTISTLPIQDLGVAANYYFTDTVTNTNFVVNKPYQIIANGTY